MVRIRFTGSGQASHFGLGLGDVLKVESFDHQTSGEYFYVTLAPSKKRPSPVWMAVGDLKDGTAKSLLAMGAVYKIETIIPAESSNQPDHLMVSLYNSSDVGFVQAQKDIDASQAPKAVRILNFCLYGECSNTNIDSDQLCPLHQHNKKASSLMQGAVYSGTVVKTKVVPQFDGAGTGISVSEVVHVVNDPFVAINDETAKALILVEAKEAGVDINSVVEPVEVRLQKS